MISYFKAIELLASGAVGVIPTDTVYGLACSAANEAAVARLYALKNREQKTGSSQAEDSSREAKPGTIIAASIEQLIALGIRARYVKAVAQYWPGSISIIIPSHELAYIHLGVGSIAVRIPSDWALQKFLEKTGPLLTSSANRPGQPEAVTINQAQSYFGDSADFYVDGGNLSGRKPSTIIRIIDDVVDVVRQGGVIINKNGEIQK